MAGHHHHQVGDRVTTAWSDECSRACTSPRRDGTASGCAPGQLALVVPPTGCHRLDGVLAAHRAASAQRPPERSAGLSCSAPPGTTGCATGCAAAVSGRSGRPTSRRSAGSLTSPLRTAWDLGRLASPRPGHRGAGQAAASRQLHPARAAGRCRTLQGYAGRGAAADWPPRLSRVLSRRASRRCGCDGWTSPAFRRRHRRCPSTVGGVEVYRHRPRRPRAALRLRVRRAGASTGRGGQQADDRRGERTLAQRFGWDVEGVGKANVYGPKRDVEGSCYTGSSGPAERWVGARVPG